MPQSGDSLRVLGQREMLFRRVIEVAVAGAIGDDGAGPARADDVHVARAGFDDEAGARALSPNCRQHSAYQSVVLVAQIGVFGAVAAQFGVGRGQRRYSYADGIGPSTLPPGKGK